MQFYWFLLAALGIWRITHLLAAEPGPWRLLERLRTKAGRGAAGELVTCFYCLSVWVAVPFAFFSEGGWGERLLVWPALSAAAILLERVTDRQVGAPPFYIEDPEETSDVLRKTGDPGA